MLSRVGNHVLQLLLLMAGIAFFTSSQAQTGNISVEKESTDGTYTPGQSVTYTISATNIGPTTVTGLTITDVFPAEFAAYVYNTQALANASITSGGSGQGNASSNTPVSPGTLSAVVNINPGGSVVLVINAVVRMSTSIDPLENTASLIFPSGFNDTD